MHTCPECGKKMATAGGLEIHTQLAHKTGAPSHEHEEVEVEAAPGAVRAAAPRRVEAASAATLLPVEAVPMEGPGSRSTLRAVPLVAFAIVALLIAGVASALVRRNETPSTPLAMLRASASTTADAGTARVSVTVGSDSGVLARGVTVDGGYDFDHRRASMEIDPSKFGLPAAGKIQAIVDYSSGLVMYMKFPTNMAVHLGNKPWLKIDVGSVLKQEGFDVDLGSLFQGQSNDPTQGLGMVRGADSEVVVGAEDVRGTPTTHYRVTVNLDKAIADAPSDERDTLTKLSALYTVRTFPVDVWLDSAGRVRRYQQTIDSNTIRLPANVQSQANPFAGHVTVSYELYDFGANLDVQIPSSDQVTDLNNLIKQGR